MSKKIKTWSNDIKVGIWDNETWTLTLYNDKAILHMPYVKWVGNSGSLAEHVTRFDTESGGKMLERFKKIAAQEIADNENYTDRIKELVWDIA